MASDSAGNDTADQFEQPEENIMENVDITNLSDEQLDDLMGGTLAVPAGCI